MVTTNSRKYGIYLAFKDHGKDYNTLFKNKNLTGYKWLHENEGAIID